MEITLAVRTSTASTFHVIVTRTATVAELKRLIEARGGFAADRQRVIHRGRILQDQETLESYGIEDNQTVHLVVAPASASSGAPSAPRAAGVRPAPAAPSSSGAGGAPAPLFGFPGAGAGPSLPGLGGMGVQGMQERLMRNPELLEQVWSSPMMQQLLNNPDMLRSMLESTPQMRALLEANPSLNHILNDPAVMRQTMEAMRNPSAMREMMRSQDLAMSQLENHPEGFNALRRMYHEVQEPMMEATMGSHAPSTSTPSPAPANASASGAVPNPWATRRPQPSPAAPGGATLPGLGALGSNPMGSNPFLQAMMGSPGVESMMSDPNILEQMVQSDPLIRQMADANPQFRSMLTNPDIMRAAMAMHNNMRGGGLAGGVAPAGFGGQFQTSLPPRPPQAPTATPAAPAVTPGLDFSSLLGGSGIATATPSPSVTAAPPPAVPAVPPNPAERYASQLRQLEQMGFSDQGRNLRALQESGGNVNAAVERLLR